MQIIVITISRIMNERKNFVALSDKVKEQYFPNDELGLMTNQ